MLPTGSYKICSRCVMDTTDPNIAFDSNRVCNHCKKYDFLVSNYLHSSDKKKLTKLIEEIKRSGKNKEYDCMLGLSGGVDSSYVAYLAKKHGLRPLAVHLDNGWDSEMAVKNIENIVRKLNIDLHTHVIDWGEFKDLQRSFFKAGVVDIEMLTDHAITAILYRMADENGIKYILDGGNLATEGIMPVAWTHRKSDLMNIKAIQKRYGTLKIKTFPTASTFKLYFWYGFIKKIKSVRFLDYVTYNKNDAVETIKKELGWRYYGLKHYESIFTRFYQGYILPNKFNIDKRKAHFSTLICSRQMTRKDALDKLKEDQYDPKLLVEDKDFVLKKLGFTKDEFDEYMKSEPTSHFDYGSDEFFFRSLRALSLIFKNRR